MNEKLKKGLYYADKFINSDYYIALISVLILIGWGCSVWVPMICVVFALGIFPLFICRNTKSVLIPVMLFTFIVSTGRRNIDGSYVPLLILAVVLVAGMIFNVVRFKRDFSSLHPARIKGFHAALLALAVPFALGGVGSPYERPAVVLVALALVIGLGVVYTFLSLTTADELKKVELPEYLLKILFAAGIIVSVELIVYFARLKNFDAIFDAMLSKEINLGWGGANNVAPILSMTIPATFYFCIRKNCFTPVFAAVALIEYALVFTTGCRGVILFVTVAMPAFLMYVAIKSENKVSFCLSVWGIFLIFLILVAFHGAKVAALLTEILQKELKSSGRDILYREGIDAFKKWPVFGAGWDFRHGERTQDMFTPYWYHSTAVQILANMGVCGAIFFAIFYYWRYRTHIAKWRDPACLALFAGVLLFDLYGMIDTNFFGPTFFIMLMIMTMVVELNVGENRCRAFGGRDPVADIRFFVRSAKQRLANKKAEKKNKADNAENDGQNGQSNKE